MPPTPAARTPRAALAELLAGNRRFVSGQPVHGHDVTAAAAVASGDQQPYAVLLGCIDSRVPLEALTLGMRAILHSRRALLLAFGEKKAEAVRQLVLGLVTPRCPASFLQLHTEVSVWVDAEAAKLLPRELLTAGDLIPSP